MPTTIPTTTSSTRPGSPSAGDAYFETDTKNYIIYDGTFWRIYNYDSAIGWAGLNRYALDFDGSNDGMTVPSTTDFAFGTSGFSISFWFKPDGTNSGTKNIFDMRGVGVTEVPSLWLSSVGAGSDIKYYASGSYLVQNLNVTINSGTWYHLLITNDGSTTDIFLDGNSTAIATGSDTTNYEACGLSLGKYYANTSYSFSGSIDEFAIFGSDQTSNLSTIYNSGVPGNLGSLNPIAWWQGGDGAEGGTGTTIYDMSSNSHDGTLINGASIIGIGSGESIYA